MKLKKIRLRDNYFLEMINKKSGRFKDKQFNKKQKTNKKTNKKNKKNQSKTKHHT